MAAKRKPEQPAQTVTVRVHTRALRKADVAAGVGLDSFIVGARTVTVRVDPRSVCAIVDGNGAPRAVIFGSADLARAALAAVDAAASAHRWTAGVLVLSDDRAAVLRAAATADGFTPAPGARSHEATAEHLAARGYIEKSVERAPYTTTRHHVYRITDAGRVVLAQLDAAAPTTTPEAP